MKILHVADLHLEGGYNRVGNEKNKILKEEGLLFFEQLVSAAKSEKAEAVMICGDLFDKLAVRKSTIKYITERIAQNPGIKFFYCLGNHDHKLAFEEDRPENLIIFPPEFTKYDLGEVVIGGNSVIKYVKRDFVGSVDFDKNRLNIFMLHAHLSSANYDDCLTFEVKDLKNKNIDYLALGHVHTRMEGKIDERGEWVYAGNGGKYGFGNYPRGYIIIEVKDGKLSWERKNFKLLRNFYDVDVDISTCENFKDLKARILESTQKIGRENFVRVVFKGECEENFEKHTQMLIDEFSEKFFYFDIRDESKIKIDLEKIAAETLSLKAEMIKLIFASNLSDAQKDACVKAGISALRGEEVEI